MHKYFNVRYFIKILLVFFLFFRNNRFWRQLIKSKPKKKSQFFRIGEKKKKSTMKYIIPLVMLTVFCQCDMSADLQKVFTENEIIPDTLNTAPKKILNVDII